MTGLNPKGIAVILTILVSIWLFSVIVTADQLGGITQFVLGVLVLGASGHILQRLLGLEGEWGLLLLRERRGLEIVDKIANWNPKLWETLTEIGFVMGFGASAILIHPRISRRTYALSLLLLLGTVYLIVPYILPIAVSVISFPVKIGELAKNTPGVGIPFMQLIVIAIIFLGGFGMATAAGLVMNGANILVYMAQVVLGMGTTATKVSPGASFMIPGKNLPLIEGILALAVLLFVHELAHGIMARLGKIKLDSAGIVMFGILPMGAFVDPDEKQLMASNDDVQKKVLVAGSTANFLTFLVSFFVLIGFLLVINGSAYEDSIVVDKIYNGTNLSVGMTIIAINNVSVYDVESYVNARANVSANSSANITTNLGVFEEKTDSGGNFAFYVTRPYKAGWSWAGFVYRLLALIFVLNFLVGSVNLLPIPMFDGHRIVALAVKNNFVMRVIAAIIVGSFLVNFLPWIWM
ncbi:MAG: site-2 protease family protein [Candidatus Micrarchaeota archaeon]